MIRPELIPPVAGRMKSPVSPPWTALIEALARLDPASREIILLADVMGLSRTDVAMRLGLSLREVRPRLALARLRLHCFHCIGKSES